MKKGFIINGVLHEAPKAMVDSAGNLQDQDSEFYKAQGYKDVVYDEIPVSKYHDFVEVPVEHPEYIRVKYVGTKRDDAQIRDIYKNNIHNAIRAKYSIDDELGLQRRQTLEPKEYKAYNDAVTEIIASEKAIVDSLAPTFESEEPIKEEAPQYSEAEILQMQLQSEIENEIIP